jgi:ribosomal-protein-alanine N-acetyltransferase
MSVEGEITSSPRLMLREACMDDASFIFKLLNSPSWIEFIGNFHIISLQHAEKYIRERLQVHYATHGFGLWTVVLKETGQSIGICGVLRRNGLEYPDLGFAFLPEFEGFGFASEAANATLEFASDQLLIPKILAITTEGNLRSRKLLLKLGFEEKGTVILPGETKPLLLYGIEQASQAI